MTTSRRRSALEISIVVVCFFGVWALRATYLYAIDAAIASDTWRAIYSILVKLMLWVGPAIGFAHWRRQASPPDYLGLTTWPSGRQWLVSVAVTGLFLGAVAGFESLSGRKGISLAGLSIVLTLPGFLATVVSPLLEEVLFRGLLLKETAALLPGWKANLVASLLFAGVHLPFWLSQSGWTVGVLANTVGVLAFSLVAGWLYRLSASVWPSYLAHVANNCVAALLVAG